MITRGIVEKLLDRYTIKVRMPILNRMKQNSNSILSDDLNEAVVSVPPNFDPNINVGDVVFVAFEDNNFGKPVVIGYLYRSNMTPTYGDIILNSINVKKWFDKNNIKISKKDILIFGTNYEIEKSKEYAKEKIPQFKNK